MPPRALGDAMDRNDLLALAPHYAAMLVLVLVVLAAWRSVLGPLDLVGEFIIIALIVFSYRPAVKRLGIAPEPWVEAAAQRRADLDDLEESD